jgi:hypothetical protein
MTKHYTQLSRWVQSEMMEHASLLTRMRERLVAGLEEQPAADRDGNAYVKPADVTAAGVPNNDWCRAYTGYRDGFKILMEEQRKRDEMVLMARNKSQTPMTDEEYTESMAVLMNEALAMASDDQLREMLAKRSKS